MLLELRLIRIIRLIRIRLKIRLIRITINKKTHIRNKWVFKKANIFKD